MSEAVAPATTSAPVSAPSAPAPAAAPSPAPATSAPTSPSSPAPATPGFDPKQHATMKGALDAFVKSKVTAAIEQTAEPSDTASAPATPAETVAPIVEDVIQPAEKAQTVGDGSDQSIDVSPDPELNLDPKVTKSVSPRVRAVLKMLVDPATKLPIGASLRKEIVDNYFVGKSVRDSGVPVAALRSYLEVAPTPDVLANVSENATQHARMLADYAENPSVFAEQLYHTNSEAFQNFVSSLTNPEWLQATFPKSFSSIAKTGTYNYLENALADAQKSGDADLEAAAARLMEWGGLASPPQSQPEPQRAPDPAQQRIEELEQERAQFQQERQNQFLGAAYQRAAGNVVERIAAVVAQASADSPFNEKTQLRIRDEIGRKLYATVTGNQHIIRTLDGLVKSGQGDQAHFERVSNYLQSQALAVLPSVSREVIEEYSELVGPAVAQRQQKVEKVLAQRSPVSGGGKPPASPAPAFNPQEFKTTKDAFDAFVRSRLGG